MGQSGRRSVNRFFLIGCGKQKKEKKGDYAWRACELYTGPIFKARQDYAIDRISRFPFENRYWVVSAKHGLVDPQDFLQPYDMTIRELTPIAKQRWAMQVVTALLSHFTDLTDPHRVRIDLHMGADYAELLQEKIIMCGMNCTWPVQGMGQGEQLHWYKEQRGSLI